MGHNLQAFRSRQWALGLLRRDDYVFQKVDGFLIPVVASAALKDAVDGGASETVIAIARGHTRRARLTFAAKCIVGSDPIPNLVFVPPFETPQSPEATFELIHEIGHGTSGALEAEFLVLLDPLFVLWIAVTALHFTP